MKYCSACGNPVIQRIPEGDNRPRYVCDICQTIHYQNPNIVAGALPSHGSQVLLCRRAIEPRRGYWTLPAGFMENGETIEQAAEREASRQAANWLLGAILTGFGFIVVKLTEYAAAFEHNISLSSSPFHMFYLSLTFFHFMHVILGLVILIAMWNGARQGRYRPGDMNGLETGAAYWHMVDLVWLILFLFVYVV